MLGASIFAWHASAAAQVLLAQKVHGDDTTAAELWSLMYLCASLHTEGGATEHFFLLYCAHRGAPQVATFTRDTERLQANLEKIRSEIR